MKGPMNRVRTIAGACLALFGAAFTAGTQTTQAPDITKQPTLYVVPYAHLDTQWRWEFPQTISEYLLKTMRVNFDLIEKYPHYVFNWTGANRYRLMKEYFPADYARVQASMSRLAVGIRLARRWKKATSTMPSAEAILRQVLYGNSYFRKEFGKASAEYHAAGLLWFPGVSAQHSGARRA